MMSTHRLWVAAAVGTLWLIGGLVYPLLAIASADLSAFQITAVRTTGAMLMTTPVLLSRVRGRLLHVMTPRVIWVNVVAAVAFYPIGNGLLTFASARLPSAVSALAFSLFPVLAAVVTVMRGELLGRLVWLGMFGAGVSMAGVVGAPDADVPLLPLFAALASVVFWFAGTEFWSKRDRETELMASVWIQLLIGSIACWVLVIATGDPIPSADDMLQPVMLLLAFSQFIQHVAYLGIAGRISPLILTSFAYVNPVVAAFTGYVLLEQELSAFQIGASLSLLVSVVLVVRGAVTPRSRA